MGIAFTVNGEPRKVEAPETATFSMSCAIISG